MNRIQAVTFLIVSVVVSASPASLACAAEGAPATGGLIERVEHRFADSNGVKIHYVSVGSGPLVVMIHGFPDYWYTWRDQMEALADRYQVVAMDTRGYNKSDAPAGVAQYAMPLLLADVAAVIRDCGRGSATVVGHDWGGAIAWNFAMYRGDMVDRLVILNLPHPNGMRRELAANREQRENSQYARDFQAADSHEKLSAEGLAGWVRDPAARRLYVEAFRRSSFEGMMNYYRANYPATTAPSDDSTDGAADGGASTAPAKPVKIPPAPRVAVPVLMFHGLEDPYLLHQGLNGTWEWIDADLTLVTIPGASHFVQQDASDLVSGTLRSWLDMRTASAAR